MRIARKQRGFTIIEVLIVLAVTAAMFLMAAIAVSGKQNTTEFQQAINDVQSKIQQSISNVTAGDYPDIGNFTCSAAPGGPITFQAGQPNQQGANGGCVFLGSALQFGVKGTNSRQFNAYTIAGLQQDSGRNEVTSLAAATPLAIAPSLSSPSMPSAIVTSQLLNGLAIAWMKSGNQDLAAVAFISTLGQDNINDGAVSGSQSINLYAVPAADASGHNAMIPADSATAVEVINNNLASAAANPSQGVQICFASGTTNQSGLITIGSNGRSLSDTLQIKDGKSC
jgi:prepilin-type N-terminal cleavage/methylation domain-containing protein